MRVFVSKNNPRCSLVLLLAIFACEGQTSAQNETPTAEGNDASSSGKAISIQPVTLDIPIEAPKKRVDPNAPKYAQISITSTLEGGFVRAVGRELGPALAQVAKRALVWWVNPRTDFRKNDKIEIVYSVHKDKEPTIHAIWFSSQKLKTTKTAVWYKAEKNEFHRWFQPDGSELALRLKNSPIRRYEQITSLLKDGRGHKGMDFKSPVGSKIYAPFPATVVRRNWSTRRNGLCLDLQRSDGIRIYLLHLDKILPNVRVGTRVKTGQHIAFSGNTGRSTAPHLHYQIEKTQRGRVLDPLKMHKTSRFRLQGDEVKRMRLRLSRLKSLRSEPVR